MTQPSDATFVGDDRRRLRPGGDAVAWSPGIIDGSIPERWAEIVRRSPDRPAVVADGIVTSYAGLDVRSAAVARAVEAALPSPMTADGAAVRAIALLLDQGADLPAAVLGALRTGAAIVPVDPAYPDDALSARLEHADSVAILAASTYADVARRVAGDRPVIDLGLVGGGDAEAWRDPSIAPDAPATLFYTSGSTGRPKGVLDSHRNVLHNVGRYTTSLAIGSEDRLTLIHAPTFSGIVSTLFGALLNGAALLPYDLRHRGLDGLAGWLRDERATMLHAVPIVARSLFAGTTSFPDLRVARLEGDVASWSDVERFTARTSDDAMLVNGLGATETGLTRQFFVAHGAAAHDRTRTGALPIGYAVPDMAVTVVDADGRIAATGSAGEIVVTSRYLAIGYHRDPERTAAAFRADPTDPTLRSYRTGDLGRMDLDRRLHHLGRMDGVHKVNGQTVDPAETELALEARPEVRAAVVVTRLDGPDADARLVGYVVREPGHGLDLVRLRRDLGEALPAVQVPTVILEIPAVPVTSAGKVDRAALPTPGHARPPLPTTFRAPTDPLEEELATIWSETIGVSPIGIDDDFFELGGDSLAALRMLLEVGTAYGQDVPADVLARTPTVAGVAAAMRRTRDRATDPSASAAAPDPGVLPLADGDGRPVFVIHAADERPWLFRSVARSAGWRRPLISLGPDGRAGSLRADADIGDTASAHLDRIRAIQPSGPYHLAGFCYGGVIAFEVAHRLHADGEEIARLSLLSVTPLEFPTLISPAARRRYDRSVLRERGRWLGARWRAVGASEAFHETFDRATALAAGAAYRWRARHRATTADLAVEADAPDLRAARAAAIGAYVARPFPGEVTVVIGRDAVPRFVRDPHADFAGLSTLPIRVAVLAGDDHAMLAEPEAAALARILSGGPDEHGRYDSVHDE